MEIRKLINLLRIFNQELIVQIIKTQEQIVKMNKF